MGPHKWITTIIITYFIIITIEIAENGDVMQSYTNIQLGIAGSNKTKRHWGKSSLKQP